MLTIYGRLNSINVQKVVWAAGEVGQAFTRIDAGAAFGVNTTPEYHAKNPNGLVPLLEDGALCVWESNAIVRYLAAQYGQGTLWDADAGKRSLSDRWMDWQLGDFYPAMANAFMGLVRTPEDKRDATAIEVSREKTELRMALLDAHLAANTYLGGDAFGVGDIAMGPPIHRWLNMPIRREPRPHVQRWYELIAARPASKAALILPVT